MDIKNKKISILGAVRSGLAAAKLAKRQGGIPFVSDSAAEDKLIKAKSILDEEDIKYEFGGHTDKVFECDFVITSPGVPTHSKIIQDIIAKGIRIFSEVEFASWFCKGNIIAITGTNGKTTTTSLCNHLINSAGLKSYSAGNIGYAFSEISDKVLSDEFVALETSSFQLDYINNFKPKFSMILNITPDHLDRYNNSVDQYANSKYKIFKNQDDKDFLILNADDDRLNSLDETDNVKRYYFSLKNKPDNGAYLNDGHFYFVENNIEEKVCSVDDLFIKGEHNWSNSLSVLIAAKLLNISNEKIADGFGSFKGVEHRLELVRIFNGIQFINDSKATNVDSVWYALRSFDQKIYLILGGKDKGNNYDQIKNLVKEKVNKIYAIGSSAEKVFNYFNGFVEVEKKESLEDCVKSGSIDAQEDEIVLLSPACASFDMFENYEHRGEIFKKAVMSLN